MQRGTRQGDSTGSGVFNAIYNSAVQRARDQVAALIGARRAADIVFTSCGSESTATAFHAARHRADLPSQLPRPA